MSVKKEEEWFDFTRASDPVCLSVIKSGCILIVRKTWHETQNNFRDSGDGRINTKRRVFIVRKEYFW